MVVAYIMGMRIRILQQGARELTNYADSAMQK
jgi:hypothetical protein